MQKYLFSLIFIFGLALTGCGESDRPTQRLKITTTTSVDNSGLLNILLPAFEKEVNYRVDVIAVGTGKALKLAKNGDIDAVIVHSPPLEEKFVADGFGINRRHIMSNDFFIIGPPDNPAKIEMADPAPDAFQKIARTKSLFLSRGDESGTHQKEKSIWLASPMNIGGQETRLEPKGKWYLECGQGMGATLIITNEKNAYCLVDRGTYFAYKKKLGLVILCRGDQRLLNPYSIIAVNPARYPEIKHETVIKLTDWLLSPKIQKMIGEYQQDGETLFDPANPERN